MAVVHVRDMSNHPLCTILGPNANEAPGCIIISPWLCVTTSLSNEFKFHDTLCNVLGSLLNIFVALPSVVTKNFDSLVRIPRIWLFTHVGTSSKELFIRSVLAMSLKIVKVSLAAGNEIGLSSDIVPVLFF